MSKFTYVKAPITGEEADYYERRYIVSVDGAEIGSVALCHSGDWTFDGIDMYVDTTTATRDYAAKKLLAKYLARTGGGK